VLEDYHLITEMHIHETLIFFLDHLPPDLHVVMLTRSEPPFPLVRWRVRGELCEVQAAELRFSSKETENFFQRTLDSLQPASFSEEFLYQVNKRVEGWAAGLRLLVLTLQGSSREPGLERALTNFAGNQRSLQEYFVTEVLNAQPQELQDFLLCTSILTNLTGSLCDTVAERHESERLLEIVQRAGLFLESLDGSGAWYRYHALFAEAMHAEARRRLGSKAMRSLYLRASQWYEQQGMHAEAIEAAFQAQDAQRAARLIEHLFETSENFVFGKSIFQKAPEFHTLRRWLEQLPEEILSARPLLCLGYAESILFVFVLQQSAPELSAMKQLAKALQMAEDGWRREGNQLRLGEVFAFRALTLKQPGAMREAVSYARLALALLPADAVEGRMMSLWFVGMGEMQEGHLNVALAAFLEVQAFCETLEHAAIKRANTVWLSGLYYAQGELQQAAESFHRLLVEARAAEDIDDICDALLGLAQLSYEWNELATAEQQVREALELARQLANHELQVQATLILARIEHARGEIPEAQRRCVSQLASLPALLPQRARLVREIQVMQAKLALTQGDFAALERWWTSLTTLDELPHSQRDREALLRVRWLLHQEQAQNALDLLEMMVQDAQAEGRSGTVWEIQLLMVLASAALKRLAAARRQLQELLEHVHAAGYVRLFLDEGEPLAALLQSILPTVRGDAQRVALKRLLLAFAQQRAVSIHSSSGATLAEPLSTREQRVLHLLAAGHSNPEIAQTLVVSVNTVKAQVQSIYRKLNVTNRVEASEVARMLNLL
jgi:LuxR family maltose regulon positive regulatory protein